MIEMPEGKPQIQSGQTDLSAQVEEVVAEYVRTVSPSGEVASIEPRVLNKLISRLPTRLREIQERP